LVVARLGHLGDGVCATQAGEDYVPYALPGETVVVEEWCGHPDRRQLIEVERASHERVAPICPHFGLCGGCALQHWARRPYQEWKRALVVDALARVGLDAPLDTLIDAHGDGRRRAVFHARRGSRDILEVGFAARKSHQVIAIDRCPILAPQLDRAVATAWAIAEQVSDVRKPLDIQVTASEGGLDVDVRGSGPLSAPQITRLADVAEQHRLARLTRHGEIISQRVAPTVRIGRARVKLPPGAFLQATAAGETALARLVETHCAAAATVADLFCGVGPFALRLAERARVRAIDSDATAIAALQQAANATSGLKRVQAETRDLFRRPLRPDELTSFDAVVFDPPRQGGEAQARALAASALPTIVAVSCNPATFARDARVLAEGGYRLARVTPVDQFLYSTHVEVVALLQRAHGV
ncbi:MAG: class I SAM-dependent RNA methyltransferase, partial [Alphaproteobacteria bacterium]